MAGNYSTASRRNSAWMIGVYALAAIGGFLMGGVAAVQTSQKISLLEAIKLSETLAMARLESVRLPKIPNLHLPELPEVAKLRDLKTPQIPDLQLPKIPIPKLSVPKIPNLLPELSALAKLPIKVPEAGPLLSKIPGFQQQILHPALKMAPFATTLGQDQVTTLVQLQAEIERLTFSVPQQFQGTIVDQSTLKNSEPVIALTIDDGPAPGTTEQMLDILKQEDVKATFFWLGKAVQSYPELARRVLNEGHAIGNHTWHHWYNQMNQAEAASEIENTAKIIYEATGAHTSLFRPPGGFLHNGVADYALSQKYAVIMWSDTSADTDPYGDTQAFVDNVLTGAKSGAIILMHDGGGDRSKTVAALPLIIAGLKQQGYRFVTIPQLLKMQNQRL